MSSSAKKASQFCPFCRTKSSAATSGEALWVVPRGEGFDYKDFEMPNVFPNGCISIYVPTLPGTDLELQAAWRIYIDSGRYAAPMNKCVKHKFNVDWPGNIVMAKHRRRSDHIAQVAYGEEDFADVVLALWLKEFVHVKNRLGVKLFFHSEPV
ncbi:hypothetical protein B0H16DRAFT_1733630 [Mycena metata]|uniref:Uncharacterized protein n=1 Tax=Mycena metata TaxID=1033252 RepID=A0AAD7HZU2_9AGAR|nr:hypothetical protein B0H16DRAFT_1733630 [Mycena metata]